MSGGASKYAGARRRTGRFADRFAGRFGDAAPAASRRGQVDAFGSWYLT